MARHVLVAIDGSEPSWVALDYALDQHEGSAITTLHVVDPIEGMHGGFESGYFDAEAFDRARERGEDLGARARERAEAAGVLESTTVDTVVEVGRPAPTIVRFAEEHDVDHVVLGSQGRTGISRVLLGSVAETVARRSPVPVTIVR